LAAGRVLRLTGLALATAAGLALAASALPGWFALALWVMGALWTARELRALAAVRAVELHFPDQLLMESAAGESSSRLLSWRRVGPLLVLRCQAEARMDLALWLPGLPMNERRRFLRGLACVQSDHGASV